MRGPGNGPPSDTFLAMMENTAICYVSCPISGSVATGRASHAGQVKGDDPDKKGYPGPPGWGLWHGADNPIPTK
jgi:hypothetical protein